MKAYLSRSKTERALKLNNQDFFVVDCSPIFINKEDGLARY